MIRKNLEKIRKSILIGMCVLLSGVLFAQEQLIYVAEKDTTAFNWENNSKIELQHGERIILDNTRIYYSPLYTEEREYHIKFAFTDFNSSIVHMVRARDFRPANTEDTFSEDIFIDYPSDTQIQQSYIGEEQLAVGDAYEMWVPNYYCDVLVRRDREKLFELHHGLDDLNDVRAGTRYIWYDNAKADIQNGRAMFFNSVIKLGFGTNFAVRNIKKTIYGYNVDCIESIRDDRYPFTSFTNSVFWDKYKPGDTMTLYIHLDGEYMDIYVDGNEILLGTFVKVKREFIRQYQSLIKTNTCDLTNVQWPRRADGSMGPPKETPNITITPRPIEESFDTASATEDQLSAQNTEKVNSLPFWVWLAIAGVAVAGGVAVFVVRRKK